MLPRARGAWKVLQEPTDPLRRDVRLLGRILGEAIKEQDGEAFFRQVEAIRQASVRHHRGGPEGTSEALNHLLSRLSLPETARFVHSFACFLQIANIAEDQDARRRA